MIKYIAIAAVSGVLSAFAQILLKKSSLKKNRTGIREYLNPEVICGYGLTAVCMILMILAYRGLPYKYGAIIESLVYFHVMILSYLILGEPITRNKLIGNLIIVAGVIVFAL